MTVTTTTMTGGTRNWSTPAVTNDITYENGGEKKRPQGGRMARPYKTFCIESKEPEADAEGTA